MEQPLKILFIEDMLTDAEMIWREISKNKINFEKKLVENKTDYIDALKSFKPDLIISDYSLPQFDGMSALLIKNEISPLVPFILVTGSINEEVAVEIMKAGADDYVIKQHLSKLGASIQSALNKKLIFLEKESALNALRESEEKHRILLEEASDPIFSITRDGQYMFVNKAFAEGVGRKVKDITHKTVWEIFPKEEAEKRFAALNEVFQSGEGKVIEVRVPRKDADRYYLTTITPIKDTNDNVGVVICSAKEITERKAIEDDLKIKIIELEQFNELAVNREVKMIELKKEVNLLLGELGRKEKFKIVE